MKSAAIFFNILNFLLAGNLPPMACICVIVEDQGRYLVLQRPDGRFVFPAGFVRWREYPTQAAQREGKEETGLDLRVGEVVGYSSGVSSRFNSISALTLIYEADVVGGELQGSIEGQPCWVDESDVHTKLTSAYRKMLDDYLRYRAQRNLLKASGLISLDSGNEKQSSTPG